MRRLWYASYVMKYDHSLSQCVQMVHDNKLMISAEIYERNAVQLDGVMNHLTSEANTSTPKYGLLIQVLLKKSELSLLRSLQHWEPSYYRYLQLGDKLLLVRFIMGACLCRLLWTTERIDGMTFRLAYFCCIISSLRTRNDAVTLVNIRCCIMQHSKNKHGCVNNPWDGFSVVRPIAHICHTSSESWYHCLQQTCFIKLNLKAVICYFGWQRICAILPMFGIESQVR